MNELEYVCFLVCVVWKVKVFAFLFGWFLVVFVGFSVFLFAGLGFFVGFVNSVIIGFCLIFRSVRLYVMVFEFGFLLEIFRKTYLFFNFGDLNLCF